MLGTSDGSYKNHVILDIEIQTYADEVFQIDAAWENSSRAVFDICPVSVEIQDCIVGKAEILNLTTIDDVFGPLAIVVTEFVLDLVATVQVVNSLCAKLEAKLAEAESDIGRSAESEGADLGFEALRSR